MKKLEHFNPSLITETFFPQYVDTPQMINYGQCFQWSYLCHQVFAGCGLWCVGTHAFIKRHHNFYDSETLQGTPDYLDMPANNAAPWMRQPLHKHLRHSFMTEWVSQTIRFNTSWGELDKQATKLIRSQLT